MRVIFPAAALIFCLIIPTVAIPDQIDDILRDRAPLFRAQIQLTNALAGLDNRARQQAITKFHAQYGKLQKYQQLEARLADIARNTREASVALNTEANRLASRLPTVAPAPTEFLA